MTTSACTLPTLERPLRLAEFDELFTLARAVAYDGQSVRIHLSGPPTLRDQVVDLTDRETECCSFFRFTVDGTGSEVDLVITTPDEHQPIVAAIAARAALAP